MRTRYQRGANEKHEVIRSELVNSVSLAIRAIVVLERNDPIYLGGVDEDYEGSFFDSINRGYASRGSRQYGYMKTYFSGVIQKGVTGQQADVNKPTLNQCY